MWCTVPNMYSYEREKRHWYIVTFISQKIEDGTKHKFLKTSATFPPLHTVSGKGFKTRGIVCFYSRDSHLCDSRHTCVVRTAKYILQTVTSSEEIAEFSSTGNNEMVPQRVPPIPTQLMGAFLTAERVYSNSML